jgi:hypothetical protein
LIHLAKDQRRALVKTVINLFRSTKCREYLEWLSNYRRLKEDSVTWSYLQMSGVSRANLNPQKGFGACYNNNIGYTGVTPSPCGVVDHSLTATACTKRHEVWATSTCPAPEYPRLQRTTTSESTGCPLLYL